MNGGAVRFDLRDLLGPLRQQVRAAAPLPLPADMQALLREVAPHAQVPAR